ncbi:MAG TPA: hypothetical protein VNB24_02180 [Acidimicrobiales bacterium]|nr:hypothetical protein [Acidimicrobiales bacterium]
MSSPSRSLRWRYVAATIAIVLVLGGIAFTRGRAPRPKPTIEDPAFVLAANQRCADVLPRLRATEDTVRSEDSREKETAEAIDRASTGIDALVADLRRIPTAKAAAPKVDAWLEAWADYTAAGRRYAAAIRAGDPMQYGRVDDESVAPLRAISRFSRANRIDACIP